MRSYTFNAGFNKPEVKAIIRKDATVNINCHYQSFTGEELSQLIMFLQSIERLAETTKRITTSLLSKEEE